MAKERTPEQKIRRKFEGAVQTALKRAITVNNETTGRLALVGVYDGRKFIVGDVSLLDGLQCSASAVQQILADQEHSGHIRTLLTPEVSSVMPTGYDSTTMSDASDESRETQFFSASQPNSSGNVSPPAVLPALQPSPPITGTSDWLSGSSFQYFDANLSQLEQDALFCAGGDPTLLPPSHSSSMSTKESLVEFGLDSTASVPVQVDKRQRRRERIERLKSRNFFM